MRANFGSAEIQPLSAWNDCQDRL